MKKQNGFTLVEVMVAMAIMAAVFAGVYMTYFSQQKSYMNQEQVAAMQQNLRAAMTMIERDLRLVGYSTVPGILPGFIEANHDSFTITYDLDDNGIISGTTETISYRYDALNRTLLRRLGTLAVPGGDILADNIDAFDCAYGSGVSEVMNIGGTDVLLAGPVNVTQILSVQVTILARSTQVDQQYVNRTTYRNQQGLVLQLPALPLPATTNPPLDNIRRRLLTMRTHCRNLWYRV